MSLSGSNPSILTGIVEGAKISIIEVRGDSPQKFGIVTNFTGISAANPVFSLAKRMQ